MLIQDSNGGCIGALRERLQMGHSNDESVVLAVQWALVFMPEIRVREATFERDSTPVFSALQLCECSFTCYGCLIQESKKMAKYFCSVDIQWFQAVQPSSPCACFRGLKIRFSRDMVGGHSSLYHKSFTHICTTSLLLRQKSVA